MSKLFNIFPDSSSEEECDFEDGKTQLCVLKGREMKMNFLVEPENAGLLGPGHH